MEQQHKATQKETQKTISEERTTVKQQEIKKTRKTVRHKQRMT